MTEQKPKLARASYAPTMNSYPDIVPGLKFDATGVQNIPYHESIRLCRYFYRRDGIANTVVNRIAEIVSTQLRNKKRSDISDSELEVFNICAARIQPYIKTIVLSYLLDGMAIPQYEVVRVMGSRLSPKLGRTRYYLPENVWCRNAEHIILKKTIAGGERIAFIRIPQSDIFFIQNRGTWPDGTSDKATYERIAKEIPEYIQAVEDGKSYFAISDYVIYRNLLPHNDYPLPYLESALNALDHKRYLKTLDRSIATRAIEAFRHVKVGNDEYPADDDDIEAAQSALSQKSSTDRVYNLFTNHTISIEWVTPPLDIIMDGTKYQEANSDIFFALGFPRILTVGETEKSNAADNKIAALGILATLKAIQNDVLQWVKRLYIEVADKNGFQIIPDPYFTAIPLADVTQLIQYARDMIELKVISNDTAAQFYGSDSATELEQIRYEKELLADLDLNNEVTQQSGAIPEQSRVPPQGTTETTNVNPT